MRLLLVDDNYSSQNSFKEDMSSEYIIDIASTAMEGTDLAESTDYDAIIVDSTVSDIPLSEICSKARDYNYKTPILVLAEYNKACLKDMRLACLESGADVFLTKPLTYAELRAQLRALIRFKTSQKGSEISVGPLRVNLRERSVWVGNTSVKLPRKEYDILEYLVINEGKIVSKEQILEHVWYQSIYTVSNTLEVHIRRLRNKIEKPFGIKLIKTSWGFGYTIES